jgi:uncharacterized membrane protein
LNPTHIPRNDAELIGSLIACTDLGLVPIFDKFAVNNQNNASGTLVRSSFGLRWRLIFCTMCGYGGICHTHRTTLPSSSRIPYLIVSPHQTIFRTYRIAS